MNFFGRCTNFNGTVCPTGRGTVDGKFVFKLPPYLTKRAVLDEYKDKGTHLLAPEHR